MCLIKSFTLSLRFSSSAPNFANSLPASLMIMLSGGRGLVPSISRTRSSPLSVACCSAPNCPQCRHIPQRHGLCCHYRSAVDQHERRSSEAVTVHAGDLEIQALPVLVTCCSALHGCAAVATCACS